MKRKVKASDKYFVTDYTKTAENGAGGVSIEEALKKADLISDLKRIKFNNENIITNKIFEEAQKRVIEAWDFHQQCIQQERLTQKQKI